MKTIERLRNEAREATINILCRDIPQGFTWLFLLKNRDDEYEIDAFQAYAEEISGYEIISSVNLEDEVVLDGNGEPTEDVELIEMHVDSGSYLDVILECLIENVRKELE